MKANELNLLDVTGIEPAIDPNEDTWTLEPRQMFIYAKGQKVKAKGRYRESTIVDVTVNNVGTVLYWLHDGGCFSFDELKSSEPLSIND